VSRQILCDSSCTDMMSGIIILVRVHIEVTWSEYWTLLEHKYKIAHTYAIDFLYLGFDRLYN